MQETVYGISPCYYRTPGKFSFLHGAPSFVLVTNSFGRCQKCQMFRIRRLRTQGLRKTAFRVSKDCIAWLQLCCTPVAWNNYAAFMQIGESWNCIENVGHSRAGACDNLNRIVSFPVSAINCGEQRVSLRDGLR